MKQKIKDYLADRYEETDDILIDELVYNLKLLVTCKKEIDDDGFIFVVEAMSRELNVTTKINPLLAVYDGRLKNIKDLCTKLGISPQDREKLKLVRPKESDFEKIFN